MRIVVLGYIVRFPLGGMVWSNLQYLMGLRELGHDVYFLEDSDSYAACYDPARNVMGTDPAYGLRFAQETLSRIGMGDRWAYYDEHRSCWLGPCGGRATRLCAEADVLLNLCGVNPLRPWLEAIPRRILVDEDPVFTQVRILHEPERRDYALGHDAFFTFAHNIGVPGCHIPHDGIPWQPTRQPVVLGAIEAAPPAPAGAFTTVMHWQSSAVHEHDGVRFGMKAESFPPYVSLPRRSTERFELAIGSASAPRAWLAGHGWCLRDPRETTVSVASYLDYIRESKAEFSVAKHGYVVSRGGWFSERSAAYMASGRPVVVEDTDFGTWLPPGAGVLAFRSPDEALAAIGEIAGRYDFHCRAAREMVEAYFDSRTVLTRMLDSAFAAGPPA